MKQQWAMGVALVTLAVTSALVGAWVLQTWSNEAWISAGFLAGQWYVYLVWIRSPEWLRSGRRSVLLSTVSVMSLLLAVLYSQTPVVWFFPGFCSAYWAGAIMEDPGPFELKE